MAVKHRTGRVRTYVDGNTVRRVREYETARPNRQSYEEIRRRKQERMARKQAARRNKSKALSISSGYVFMLAVAGLVTLFLLMDYLHVQSDITMRMNRIEQLELSLEHTKAENDALQTRINTYVDLEHIKQVATGELGMVYANQNQILLYDKTESEYVNQNENVPEQ